MFFRELLESEESKWRQQAGMEEQLRGLLDQISAAHNLTAGLQARLDDVQKQVTQVTSTKAKPWHRVAPGACFINSKLAGCHRLAVNAGVWLLFLFSACPSRTMRKFPSH